MSEKICEYKQCKATGKWRLDNGVAVWYSCGTHITTMIREARISESSDVNVRELTTQH